MRHHKIKINDDSHLNFFLSYINPICPSFFMKSIFFKFSLLKKILNFALRIASTFKNSLTKINEASNCSYLRNELNVTRKEVKSFCKYVNKDTRLLSLNFEKYPHFSVMSQQVFCFWILKSMYKPRFRLDLFLNFFGTI